MNILMIRQRIENLSLQNIILDNLSKALFNESVKKESEIIKLIGGVRREPFNSGITVYDVYVEIENPNHIHSSDYPELKLKLYQAISQYKGQIIK